MPIGVVIGPLMATPLRRTESIVSCGSGVPADSMMSTPASWTSQSNADPVVAAAASSTRRVASDSSGPVPSPGISVTRCVVMSSFPRLSSDPRGGYPVALRLPPAAREGGDGGQHAHGDRERRQGQDVDLPAADRERPRIARAQEQP